MQLISEILRQVSYLAIKQRIFIIYSNIKFEANKKNFRFHYDLSFKNYF